MAIKGRIKTEIKEKMVEMASGDFSIEEIAQETGASIRQVESVLQKASDSIEEEQIEEQSGLVDWQQKYIEAHIKLVEHGIE